MSRIKIALATAAAALVCAAPAAAEEPPHYHFDNSCGRPVTAQFQSSQTGHYWIGVWTGTDVARGAPTDGVWRLYAAAVDTLDGGGFRFAYYYWTSCYY